mmetsp:Transcript_1941/g.4268  ORF Transcript_1941/g.4268 Transcript_1941/m.4268 type:complete len:255 (+) Transcript_1941:614-1378(+)
MTSARSSLSTTEDRRKSIATTRSRSPMVRSRTGWRKFSTEISPRVSTSGTTPFSDEAYAALATMTSRRAMIPKPWSRLLEAPTTFCARLATICAVDSSISARIATRSLSNSFPPLATSFCSFSRSNRRIGNRSSLTRTEYDAFPEGSAMDLTRMISMFPTTSSYTCWREFTPSFSLSSLFSSSLLSSSLLLSIADPICANVGAQVRVASFRLHSRISRSLFITCSAWRTFSAVYSSAERYNHSSSSVWGIVSMS